MFDNREVFFTVPEFAHLVHRSRGSLQKALRDGKIKGRQRNGANSQWLIPESELSKFWGTRYGKPTGNGEKAG